VPEPSGADRLNARIEELLASGRDSTLMRLAAPPTSGDTGPSADPAIRVIEWLAEVRRRRYGDRATEALVNLYDSWIKNYADKTRVTQETHGGLMADRRATWQQIQDAQKIGEGHRRGIETIEEQGGLFPHGRGRGLEPGLRRTMINAGTPPRVANEVSKYYEAHASEQKRLGRGCASLFENYMTLNRAALAYAEDGVKGVLEEARDQSRDWYAPPVAAEHPVDGFKDLALKDESQYRRRWEQWRNSLTAERRQQVWRRGYQLKNPITVQEVDRLQQDNRAALRAIKERFGRDPHRLRADPQAFETYRSLEGEKTALDALRRNTADMRLIKQHFPNWEPFGP